MAGEETQQALVAQGAFSLYRTENVKRIGGWPDAIGEDIVAALGLDFQDFLDLGLAGLEMAEAFRGQIRLEAGAKAAVLQEMKIALTALFVESCFEHFVTKRIRILIDAA